MRIVASMEARATSATANDVASRAYADLRLGGFFLIGAGGEQSGWTQVHAAADNLQRALDEIPIVVDPASGAVLVDTGNGQPGPEDVPLLADAAAQRRLTGGILALAKDLYFARLRESTQRLGDLTRTTGIELAMLGVFSAVHNVAAVDGTAFLVTPVGLLIDTFDLFEGAYRIDQDEKRINDPFLLVGHVASALEHEVWQELTGFEAISTMKGIQRTLRDGDELMTLHYQDTAALPGALTSWGFGTGSSLPSGFSDVGNDLDLFLMKLWFPHRTTGGSENRILDVARADVDAPPARRKIWALAVNTAGSSIEAFIRQWAEFRSFLENAQITADTVSTGTRVLETTTGALPGRGIPSPLRRAGF